MKKILLIIVGVLIIFGFYSKNEVLRIRVLANSNSEYDQRIKKEVVKIVQNEFKNILKDVKNINEAREQISSNLDNVSNKIDTFLTTNNVSYKSKSNFGLNYFPAKKYKGKNYSEGYYESVLITLGNGEGDNWWCILFPSVCLNGKENVKYKSFLETIVNKILK